MNRGKAGGWACALLDEDRYYTVESEEGNLSGRIYEDFPWTHPLPVPESCRNSQRGRAGKAQREKCARECDHIR